MTPHQVKEGYLSLPPKAKREFVLWAVEREFSGENFAGLETQQIKTVHAALTEGQHSGGVTTDTTPGPSAELKVVLWTVLTVIVIAALGIGVVLYRGAVSQKSKENLAAAQAGENAAMLQVQAEREAAEAGRSSSPTNLEYLNERVGKDVTLRGVPVKSEVGYLYFHEEPSKGARVKLISGGVVVYQSTELEKWVKNQQELEIRGTLILNKEANLLEIPVDRQIQVKLVKQE